MRSYTESQARDLLPYSWTWEDGQETAHAAYWAGLGCQADDALVWGEYVGKKQDKHYLVGFDPAGPAFKCSCPGRDKPCKHAIGLLHLLVDQPTAFAPAGPPPALATWLRTNDTLRQKKARQAGSAAAPGTAAAQAAIARLAAISPKRLATMTTGAAELSTWLEELLDVGLSSPPPASAWETAAARLVDRQLPGLAATLRTLARQASQPANRPDQFLAGLSELHYLAQALRRLPSLGPEVQLEVLQQAGVTLQQEALLLAFTPTTDEWQVMAQTHLPDTNLSVHRTWLHGCRSGRYALVVDYTRYWDSRSQEMNPQGTYVGGLVYFPSLVPLRAAPGAWVLADAAPPQAPAAQSVAALLAGYAQALGQLPWLRAWPVTVGGVVPARLPDGRWALHAPAEGLALPLLVPADEEYSYGPALDTLSRAIVLSNDQPVCVFGEWDGQQLWPLNAWADPAPAPPAASEAPLADPALNARVAPPPAPAWAGPWPQLVGLAVAGTRRTPGPLPALPGPPPQGTPAQQLLQAAGTAALLQKAGFQPPTTAQLLAPLPAETWPPLGPTGAAVLHKLLEGYAWSGLRKPYLKRLLAAQRLIPPALLVPVLAHDQFRELLGFPYAALLGERGNWLTRQRVCWQVNTEGKSYTAATKWAKVPSWEQKEYVKYLRTTDPAGSRGLLARELPKVDEYQLPALLAPLLINLAADDEPLLNSLLASGRAEVRQQAVRLLAQVPGAALLERLWARARPLLSLERPSAGPPVLRVQLPGRWQAAWQADGIEQSEKRLVIEKGPDLLVRMLRLVAPSRWATHFGLTLAELWAAVAASDYRDEVRRAWYEACVLLRDLPFARFLLLEYVHAPSGNQDYVNGLASAFPDQERLALAAESQQVAQSAPWRHLLAALLPSMATPWPPALAEATLRYVAALPQASGEFQTWLPDVLRPLVVGVPESHLARFIDQLVGLHQVAVVHQEHLAYTIAGLRLRQQMTASLTEPAGTRQAAF